MRIMLPVNGISSDDVITLRKNESFPDVTLWGSAIFKDGVTMRNSVTKFNCFQKDGGNFRMEPLRVTELEIYQRFEVKREVVHTCSWAVLHRCSV